MGLSWEPDEPIEEDKYEGPDPAMIILVKPGGDEVYHHGKRYNVPDEEYVSWELEGIRIDDMEAGWIGFFVWGWTPEGHAYSLPVVHSGHYTIYWNQERSIELDASELDSAS